MATSSQAIQVSPAPSGQEDTLRIEMLGAGQEVGRSCCVLTYKGKTVVCDAGVHPAFTGIAALPFIDELDWSTVDALLITHFHLDHAAALTYIMEKTNFRDGKGKVYMTHPTKAVYRFLMSDFVRISNAGTDDNLFDENEMLASWRQIEAVDYHQEVSVGGGLRFTPYHAGHVLGACMFLIEIAGLRVLYTGDFSREEDRHLMQAEVPPVRPDVLICESTYGVQSLEPRLDKEARFTSLIHNIIRRGGRVLLPVFVLGRAQELLLLLDEYWSQHPELHQIPIYYASSLARKCISIYQTYIHTMNEHVRSRFNRRDNPFVFKHISNLRSLDKFEDKGPCVMMASPGFMQSGVSRELLERWAPDKRNGLIVSGYSVEGTMARNILNEPDEIIGMNGQKIPRRLSVDYISFSAHVDYTQNARFIDEVKAQHIVLVHGEQNNMSQLRAALQNKYGQRAEDVKIHTPRNCEPLRIKFRGDRTAKAIGAIAAKPPVPGSVLSGLLVSKDFAYTILDPKDLADFTGLSTSTIIQRQRVALGVSWEMARWHIEGMYGRVVEGVDLEGLRTMRVMDVLDIKQSGAHQLTLEWVSSVPNDMVADSAVALLVGIDSSPASVKMTIHSHKHEHDHAHVHNDADVKAEETDGVDDVEGKDAMQGRAVQVHPQSEHGLKKNLSDQVGSEETADDLIRTEHLAAFLEAHFGHVEEVAIGQDAERSMGKNVEMQVEGVKIKPDPDAELGDEPMLAPVTGNEEGVNEMDVEKDSEVKESKEEVGESLDPLENIRGPRRPALKVWMDDQTAVLDLQDLNVFSSSEALRDKIHSLSMLALRTLTPLADTFILPQPLSSNIFQGKHTELAEIGIEPSTKMIKG
ncbi:hypothetical protein IE53DRAFT_385349 [Violaceomyces palustris]|uniref:Uncharacterized protein n=1 Tax=Violaceomyces palustris TaxID=1673888 RepID=A0ACD0P292_9BASI|nr:hypothetical protein IE53DRAFT_385349 [Violaceomyces palustris]